MIEVKKRMDTAQRELFRAKEKCRSDNTERKNAKRRDEHYLVGENVCYFIIALWGMNRTHRS